MRIVVRKFDTGLADSAQIELELNRAVDEGEQIVDVSTSVTASGDLVVLLTLEATEERQLAISAEAAKTEKRKREAQLRAAAISPHRQ